MGILPMEFMPGESFSGLGLTGRERYDILGVEAELIPRQELTVRVTSDDGNERTFRVRSRIDTPVEIEYYRHGGILQYVLRQLLAE
jgi:aconitate hydratase